MAEIEFPELSEVERGYCAGLIDGEGFVGVTRYNGRRKAPGYRAGVTVAMTDQAPVYWLREKCGGSAYSYERASYDKPVHQWQVWARDAGILLRYLQPLFLVKQQQAEIVIEFASTLADRSPRPLTQEIMDKRAQLYWLSRQVNQKAVRHA